MSEKKILTKEILEYRLIPIEDFNSDELGWLEELSPEVAEKLPTDQSYRGLNLDKLGQISVKVF